MKVVLITPEAYYGAMMDIVKDRRGTDIITQFLDDGQVVCVWCMCVCMFVCICICVCVWYVCVVYVCVCVFCDFVVLFNRLSFFFASSRNILLKIYLFI